MGKLTYLAIGDDARKEARFAALRQRALQQEDRAFRQEIDAELWTVLENARTAGKELRRMAASYRANLEQQAIDARATANATHRRVKTSPADRKQTHARILVETLVRVENEHNSVTTELEDARATAKKPPTASQQAEIDALNRRLLIAETQHRLLAKRIADVGVNPKTGELENREGRRAKAKTTRKVQATKAATRKPVARRRKTASRKAGGR